MGGIPLVISFGSTLRSMADGRVKAADLVDAIFYLGCTRQYAMSERGALEEFDPSRTGNERLLELYGQFLTALEDAEAHGRVAWRDNTQVNSWEQLNDLLSSLKLPTITPFDRYYHDPARYSYQGIEDAVYDQFLPYRVIWR